MAMRMHPRAEAAYREATHGRSSMANADFVRFTCKACGLHKPVKGRKKIGHKAGYRCAECEGK